MKKIINNKYFQVGFLSFLMISLIYIIKGIFPFGEKYAMWSDLYAQITPMYYKFYDAVYGASSFFVDFNTGGGINLAGIFSYYIMSPFTLLILLFPRENIADATSLIIMFKMVASTLSAYYFLNIFFKKLDNNYKVLLSLLYTFSIYSLFYYVITGWMDGMYMFPLILIGLKKMLDLKDSKMYIITLSLSLIFSFYTTLLVLIFIFFSSYFYLYYYNRDKMKEGIYNLGLATVIAILISGVTFIPTLFELSTSARTRLDIPIILNSKMGPMIDKIALFLASAPLIVLNLFNLKKKDKFVKFLFILILLYTIPVVIEPINKMLHLGSYMYLPMRFAFIPIFLLVIGGAYYLEKEKKVKQNFDKVGAIITTFTIIISLLSLKYYDSIKMNIDKLSLSYDKKMFLILFGVFLITSIACYFLFKRKNKLMINILIVFNLLFNMYVYIGGYTESKLRNDYVTMNQLTMVNTAPYRIKLLEKDLIMNFGMVTNTPTLHQFSSMVNKVNYDSMQRFGYDSYSMDTEATGGNLFMDTILGNNYILTYQNLNDNYYKKIGNYNGITLYKHNSFLPFGYIINKNKIKLEENGSSFENSNLIYNLISDSENIFEIDIIGNDNRTYKKGEVIEKEIVVSEKSNIYLELFRDFDFQDKNKIYKSFNIYVNDNLVMEEYPNIMRNGNILLGEFEENIKVKIEVLKDAFVRRIRVGNLSLLKYEEFLSSNPRKVNIKFDGNKINVNTYGKEGEYLFLPVTYLDGYKSSHQIERVFDNFVLVSLNDGNNNITISYVSKGLLTGLIVTIIGLISFFLFNKYKIKILEPILFHIYEYSFYVLITSVYIGGLLAFLISFIYRFK